MKVSGRMVCSLRRVFMEAGVRVETGSGSYPVYKGQLQERPLYSVVLEGFNPSLVILPMYSCAVALMADMPGLLTNKINNNNNNKQLNNTLSMQVWSHISFLMRVKQYYSTSFKVRPTNTKSLANHNSTPFLSLHSVIVQSLFMFVAKKTSDFQRRV